MERSHVINKRKIAETLLHPPSPSNRGSIALVQGAFAKLKYSEGARTVYAVWDIMIN